MFLSLSKKIILVIILFFITCFGIMGYTLYSIYNNHLVEEQEYLHKKNMQYNELLYNYNKISSELENQEEIHKFINNPKNFADLKKNKNKHYQNLQSNLYMILGCLTFFAIMVILMIVFMHNLIFLPLAYISEINETIRRGIYQQRLKLPTKKIHDEFNKLETTYNNMLDYIEAQITEIKNQKEFLQNIINGIPDAIRVFDFSGNIILTNESYKNNLELQKQQSNKPVKCYFSLLKKNSPCPVANSNCPLRDLKKQKTVRFVQQLPYGNQQYLSVNASRINATKKPLIIESFRDLSNDIKFSHQQKVASLGFLTAAIAHEIKNSLGSMRLIFENMLQKKNTAVDHKKYDSLLYAQLLECIKIPERLIKIAHFAPDEKIKINCFDAIKEISALLDYEAKHNGITVDISTQPNLPNIIGNETDFKMIFLNLAKNAIKAMPEGGLLKFTLQTQNKHVEINVEDTGSGIAPKDLPHIFEPFFGGSKEETNSGLGLAIVKSLLHNFNGDIKVTSKLGKGSIFKLKFPYKPQK